MFCSLQKTMPQISGLLHVRNITKEELARMDPEERKKPYACESKSVDKIIVSSQCQHPGTIYQTLIDYFLSAALWNLIVK